MAALRSGNEARLHRTLVLDLECLTLFGGESGMERTLLVVI